MTSFAVHARTRETDPWIRLTHGDLTEAQAEAYLRYLVPGSYWKIEKIKRVTETVSQGRIMKVKKR